MAKAETSAERPGRGRPQLRSDEETRGIIYDAARHEFAANGYAATSTETVARRAGISTKTLYRLVPNKAALFEAMVSDRLGSACASTRRHPERRRRCRYRNNAHHRPDVLCRSFARCRGRFTAALRAAGIQPVLGTRDDVL
ncbi:MAG: helix-turn-helix domain-containing protein [Bradyrhizobium sp.]